MRWNTLIGTLVITLFLGGCAAHTVPKRDVDYAAGRSLYQQQQYPAAYARLLVAAQHGHAEAQYAVGYLLYQGLGVPRNQSAAVYWLQRAAKQGNMHAQQALQRLDAQQNALLGQRLQP